MAMNAGSTAHYYYKDNYYPFEKTAKLIEKIYKEIGPEKILWGSDYPATLNMATYNQLINYIARSSSRISKKDLGLIMGGNALELFWK